MVISHPQLVQTGVDFFGKDGTYNFSSIVFYETGYNLFTLRQAAGGHGGSGRRRTAGSTTSTTPARCRSGRWS